MTIQAGQIIVNRNTRRLRGKYAPKRVVLRVFDDGRLEVWHCKYRHKEIIERPESYEATGDRLPVSDGGAGSLIAGAGGMGT